MPGPEAAPDLVTPYQQLSPIWQACLQEAWEAFVRGSLPIGAVVASAEGEVLACGRNRLAEGGENAPHVPGTPYIAGTPLAHAEVNALLELGYHRPDPRAILYTTTEPCPLCMGASRMAGIGKVVYATRDAWAGAAGMAESVPYLARMGPSVEGPVAGLKAPLVAWLLAAHGDQALRAGEYVERWRSLHPQAADVGLRLNASRRLTEVGEQGVEAVWAALAHEIRTAHA